MKKILPIKNLRGEIKVPGDKSISHRAIILSALCNSTVEIENFLFSADCLSTIECVKNLGAEIKIVGAKVFVTGNGLRGLKSPTKILDAGNSGTALRLLLGLCAAQKFSTTFTGDASLSKRPIARVINPLQKMGANFSQKNLPIKILPAENLRGISYKMPIASAQVKSALLLAGLYAENFTEIVEPAPSRNHTEKMLAAFGAKIEISKSIKIFPTETLNAPEKIIVPNDISSAAYWIVLASILKNSELLIKNIGVNETRTGILDALKFMGAKFELINKKNSGGEFSADLKIFSAKLHGVELGGKIIPRMIDEIPVLAVAAAFAEGKTVIKNVGELRVKESDRLNAIVQEFNKISHGSFEVEGDNLIIHGGGKKNFAQVKTFGDHRIAMSLAIFGAAAEGVELDNSDCVKISYPKFFDFFQKLI